MDSRVSRVLLIIVVLILLCLAALVWLGTGRGRLAGRLLLGWGALALTTVLLFLLVAAEIAVACLPVAVGILKIGWEVEDRRLPHAGRSRRLGLLVLVGITVSVTCVCAPFTWYAVGSQPVWPSSSEVLPMPAGLGAVAEDGVDGRCGSGACAYSITVTGRAGEPASEVYERVKEHVKERGWPLGDDGWSCRPMGWLLDQRKLCVGVELRDGYVRVQVEGSSAFA